MKVTIASPQKLLFDAEAQEAILPGEDGEFSVMDFHQPCLYSLRQGQVRLLFRDKKAQRQRFYINSGIALIESGKLQLIVEEHGANA